MKKDKLTDKSFLYMSHFSSDYQDSLTHRSADNLQCSFLCVSTSGNGCTSYSQDEGVNGVRDRILADQADHVIGCGCY